MKKKKILFVAHDGKYSGANRSMLSLIIELKTKYDIKVLVNSKKGDLINEMDKYNIKHIYFPYTWWYSKKRKSFIKKMLKYIYDLLNYNYRKINYFKVLRLIRPENFDLVYTNTSTIDIGAFIANKINCKHIIHIREFGKEDFDFNSLVTEKYRNNIFNSATLIIVISKALENKYKKIIKETDKIKMVYNGFEIEKFICDPVEHDLNKINIIQVGQVNKSKGQVQLIKAANNLRNKGYDIELFFAGNVDHSYIDPIISKISDSNSWIHLLGLVDDVYKLRNTMDIEVICSKNEAFGRVTVEAMLHSIPVIGSNTGGTLELIKNGENGLLYEYGNIESLENKIEELINNKELYFRIMNNELKYAKKFTIKETSDNIKNILDELRIN